MRYNLHIELQVCAQPLADGATACNVWYLGPSGRRVSESGEWGTGRRRLPESGVLLTTYYLLPTYLLLTTYYWGTGRRRLSESGASASIGFRAETVGAVPSPVTASALNASVPLALLEERSARIEIQVGIRYKV